MKSKHILRAFIITLVICAFFAQPFALIIDGAQGTYTIKYDSGDNPADYYARVTGEMSDSTLNIGDSVIPKKCTYVKGENHKWEFAGWNVYRSSDDSWLYYNKKTGNKQFIKEVTDIENEELFLYDGKTPLQSLSNVPNDVIIFYTKWKAHKCVYGDLVVDKAATCTERGYESRKCIYYPDLPSHRESGSIEPLGHDWSDYVPENLDESAIGENDVWVSTCKRCGEKRYDYATKTLRIFGRDRYMTSRYIADVMLASSQAEKFQGAIVATGTNFADALSGAFLADRDNGSWANPCKPILLTNKENENATIEYIKKNVVVGGKIYILGGTLAVPDTFEKRLVGYNTIRLGGKDRYETNLKILKAVNPSEPSMNTVLVCSGKTYADALSASSLYNAGILLVEGNSLTSAQRDFLKTVRTGSTSGAKNIFIMGGPLAVSEGTEKEISELFDGKVQRRIAGSDRFATSAAFATKFWPHGTGGSKDPGPPALLVYGMNFPDGISAGPMARQKYGPIFTVTNSESSQEGAKRYYSKKSYTGWRAGSMTYIIGGPSLISDKAALNVDAKARRVFDLKVYSS